MTESSISSASSTPQYASTPAPQSQLPRRHPQQPPSAIKATMTLDDLESLKFSRLNVASSSHHNAANRHPNHQNNAGDDISLISYGTMASGLTTDFTDHDHTDGYNVREEVDEDDE